MFRFLLPFLLTSAVLAGQSQDSAAVRRLDIGVSYAYWQHEVDFTPSASVEPLPGTTYGIALRYFDNRVVGFQAELNYVNAGWREELDTTFSTLYERRCRWRRAKASRWNTCQRMGCCRNTTALPSPSG